MKKILMTRMMISFKNHHDIDNNNDDHPHDLSHYDFHSLKRLISVHAKCTYFTIEYHFST